MWIMSPADSIEGTNVDVARLANKLHLVTARHHTYAYGSIGMQMRWANLTMGNIVIMYTIMDGIH